MSLSWTQVRDLPSGEFSAQSQATIEIYMAQASRLMDVTYFGALYDDAQLYLTAHLLAEDTQGSGGGGGATQQYTAGPVSQTFVIPSDGSASHGYSGTSYGRRYWRIWRACRSSPYLV